MCDTVIVHASERDCMKRCLIFLLSFQSKTNFATDPRINLPKKHGSAVGSVFKYWDAKVNDHVETHHEV